MTDFSAWTQACQARMESVLAEWLPPAQIAPQRLHEAMRYAVLGGGKRVRPLLAFAAGEVTGADAERVQHAAAAVELIHAYSLVHDDMPAMDDDALRRGKPTVHVEFDEATALLVGDALQSLAFDILASQPLADDAATQLKMVQLLAQAAGSRGMAGGQAIDLASVGKPLDLTELEFMHIHKTGALIRASVLLGAHCGSAHRRHHAPRSTITPNASASPSRWSTTCSTPRPPPPRWARPPARMPPTTNPPMSACSAWRARANWRRNCAPTPTPRWPVSAHPPSGCASWPTSWSSGRSEMTTPLLDTIHTPADLRALPPAELPRLAAELRAFLVDSVAHTGGHLASNLGAVELTLALHYVFDTPRDRIVWDVGHQSYAHKILTGRRAGDGRPAPGRRHRRLPAPRRKRVRRLRHRPFQHLDLGRARHGRGLSSAGFRASARWRSSATAR